MNNEVIDFDRFCDWWECEGSGVTPLPTHDMEDHAYRMALLAWEAFNEWETDNEPEDGHCPMCNGSGEGMHEGTTCHSCKGRGE